MKEMSGDRPDYEVDIFNLLLDLAEQPADNNICLYVMIVLLSLIVILLSVLAFKPTRIQYSLGKPI